MLFRAERLLEEYAEAKLAMINNATSVTTEDQSSDDDEDDDDGEGCPARHYSSNPVLSRSRHAHNSSQINSKPGRKSHTISRSSSRGRENPASFPATIHHSMRPNAALKENPALRDCRAAVKLSERARSGRSPLGIICLLYTSPSPRD